MRFAISVLRNNRQRSGQSREAVGSTNKKMTRHVNFRKEVIYTMVHNCSKRFDRCIRKRRYTSFVIHHVDDVHHITAIILGPLLQLVVATEEILRTKQKSQFELNLHYVRMLSLLKSLEIYHKRFKYSRIFLEYSS